MVQCDRIRRILKLGDNMSPQQQQVAVEMMDLHVVRPIVEARLASTTTHNVQDPPHVPARYCYVKLVAPDPSVNEKYHTYFWTMDGQRLRFDAVTAFRNFQVQPYVEFRVPSAERILFKMEDIFVSKAVRSIQLKLRECLVIPPPERVQQRFSVCFPDRLCTVDVPPGNDDTAENGSDVTKRPADNVAIEPPAKRPSMEPPAGEDAGQDAGLDSCSQSVSLVLPRFTDTKPPRWFPSRKGKKMTACTDPDELRNQLNHILQTTAPVGSRANLTDYIINLEGWLKTAGVHFVPRGMSR